MGITLLRVEKFPSSPERIQRRRLIYDGPKSSRDDGRRGRSVRPRRLDGPFGRFGAFGAACVVGRASDERRRRVGRRGAAGPGRAAPGPTPPPPRGGRGFDGGGRGRGGYWLGGRPRLTRRRRRLCKIDDVATCRVAPNADGLRPSRLHHPTSPLLRRLLPLLLLST